MKPGDEERIIRIRALSAVAPTLFTTAVILVGVIKPVFEPRIDPLDTGIDKAGRVVAQPVIVDGNNNGFRVVYATAHAVTPERLGEIKSRPHIRDSISKLKIEAPRHFGDMLPVDIYDFTEYALRFDPDPDIHIHNVFVHGMEKMNLYTGPNPAIENPAEWISVKTLQGVLYINRKDILRYTSRSEKVYRYWRCRIPYERSDTDEHFSHFSEDERLR